MTERGEIEVKEMNGTHKTKKRSSGTLVRARRRSSRGMATRPPHISFEQAKPMTRDLYRGDLTAPEIIRHTFAELLDGYLPHR